MEPTKTTQDEPVPTGSQVPVMDVRPPRTEAPEAPSAGAEQAANDIKSSPQPVAAKPAVSKPLKEPKEPGSGVGLAIFATVLIVLGLAVLATYAYIATK